MKSQILFALTVIGLIFVGPVNAQEPGNNQARTRQEPQMSQKECLKKLIGRQLPNLVRAGQTRGRIRGNRRIRGGV